MPSHFLDKDLVMEDQSRINYLQKKALEYRKHLIHLAHKHSFGVHIGGGLSLAEILTALYFEVANLDPNKPDWEDRDRIILSKGHGNIGLLTVLAMRNFFSFDEMNNFNQLGSYFSMHADAHVPGIEHSAGSLGHGLSVAIGMALAARLDKKEWKVYCILGDGEIMEGSNWEALMSGSHFNLSKLTAIIDRNRLSQEGTTSETMSLEPLTNKVTDFGWTVLEIDGHHIQDILQAFAADSNGKPKMIIANTIKGRGIDSLANRTKSHFSHLDETQTRLALQQIEKEELSLHSKS
jgi:transketolase